MTKRKFKYKSAFDIIGPIMVGPSSSHTAGAVRIGKMARDLFRHTPRKLIVTFFGSFAETYKGHGTAVAIVAGVLGFETNDERIPDSLEIAEQQGVHVEFLVSRTPTDHANTVNLELIDNAEILNLTAISIGGGSIQLTEINHHSTLLEHSQGNGLLLTTFEPQTTLPNVREALENPEFIQVQELNKETIIFVETVSDISQKLLAKIKNLPGITTVMATTG
ncbi:L-serine ammonia-lyase, iron-sulfur-dependent subunit beta [Enterococcus sp. BWR-S5]|uniref:L-serine ammonia-lyase, iron-sulfur-dependent subunit beta n=1 Tax=Enterococcus sp. BWR-S5 TaxID=2787714 RepID=UPI001922A5A7|nr:L-serine ammonia-lyase, iron-sulfur-dependent subunit beta [Enterococcus sp. BWR-S5]MBL1225499.1 L-serine ammonia-lyase, iron-sulfur-dependent, subunit beta [Enterococcus sp. BWR-S5]